MIVDYDSSIICESYDSQSVAVTVIPCASSIADSVLSTSSSSQTDMYTANNYAGTTGMTYVWTFDDGSTASGITAMHSYTANGNHPVVLAATAPGGCTYLDTVYTDVFVIIDCSSLSADFTFSNYYSTVTMDNISTGPSYTYISAMWNYGDGTPVTHLSSHTYAMAGIYTISMVNTWEVWGPGDVDSTTPLSYCTASAVYHIDTVGAPYVPPNRISGHVVFNVSDWSGITDSTVKVWLIQYDSSTTILSAIDSSFLSVSIEDPAISTDTGNRIAYFEFLGKPVGNYLVKARLMGSVPGTTGYVPTYHYSSLYWNTAEFIDHVTGDDSDNDVHMNTGTVTIGPGFIGGTIASGAGKSTSGTYPDSMIVFLENASTGAVVTYTYTNATGAYAFNNIPTGNYTIYPEDLNYTTTPSPTYTISTSTPTASGVDFIQHTGSKTITPVTEGVTNVTPGSSISIYPNPTNGLVKIQWGTTANTTAHVTITDITDRKVYERDLIISANPAELNISQLKDGVYMVTVQTAKYHYTQKLTIVH